MKKCFCKTYPEYYDTRKTLEIRVSEKECDVPNCDYRNMRIIQDPDMFWYMNPQPPRGQCRSKAQSKLYNQSVLRYFIKSLADSSISGVNKVASATNLGQMFIWAVVLTMCLCGMGYQTFNFLRVYYRKPSVVQIETENDGMAEFPAVTLCNTNRFRKSEFCLYKPEVCEGQIDNITISEEDIGDIIFDILIDKNSELKKKLGHSTSMIQNCHFNGIPKMTNEECFELLEHNYDPDYGNCYTLPSKNKKGQKLEAREADFWQEANDISLLVNLESEELMEMKREPGIIVTMHDDSTSPDIHTDGLMIEAGYSYSYGLEKSTVFLLPLPFKTNCTDYSSLPWQQGVKRQATSRLCTVGCSQYYQLKKCNVVTKSLSLFYEELPYDPRAITEDDISCAEKVEMETQDYCRSVCGLPCSDIVFDVTVSIGVLTEKEMYEHHMHPDLNMSLFAKMNNFAVLTIDFSSLEHKIFRHVPKYDTMELFSYLGGYSGVWLGFSLLTVYELIEIIVSTACFAVQKHKRTAQPRKLMRNVTHPKKQGKNFKKKRLYR